LPQGHQSPQSVHNESKLRRYANQCRSQGLYAQHNDNNYHHRQHGRCKQRKLRNDGGCSNNNQDNKKSLPKCKDKGFQLCHLHGKHINHSYDKCRTNPCHQEHKLQQQAQITTKKHSRDDTCTMQHGHDDCWKSSKSSCLAELVTPSSVTKEQAQATTTKNTML
jgi:hypothetical protein